MPRKSTASNVSDGPDKNADNQGPLGAGGKRHPPGSALPQVDGKEGMLSVDDLGLPRTMVQRLAKGVLPANTQIQKDAQLAIWKSATVFVNYLTSHANENAMRVSKKTIQPKDVLDAIHDLEFDAFLPRLDAELQKYNAVQCDKRNSYRRKIREEAKAKSATETGSVPGTALSEASGGAALDGDGSGDSLTTADGPPLASAVGPSPRAATKGNSEPAAKKVRRSKDAVATDEDEEEEDMGDDEGEADAGDDDDDDEEEPEDEGEDEEEGEEEFEDAGSEVGGPSDYHDPLEYQKQDDTDDETMAADDSD